jgi:hypothetical protein
MTEHVYRIANIFGLDVNRAQHSVAIVDAIRGIEDIEGFIAYCREKKHGIEYASKTEKLDMLSAEYRSREEERKLESARSNAERFAATVAGKVKECRNFVEEEGIDFSQVGVNGEKFFSEKEVRALELLGSPIYIVELSRVSRLEEELVKLYREMAGRKSVERKRGEPERVLKMAKSAAKGM